MSYVLWQNNAGTPARTASVRDSHGRDLPKRLKIRASVSQDDDLRGQASYIQLDVPNLGPVLAWVGLPGGGQRDGWFVHVPSGRTWPWGGLADAVEFALQRP